MKSPDPDVLLPRASNPELADELDRAAGFIAALRNYGTYEVTRLIKSQSGQVTDAVGVPLVFAIGILNGGLELLSAIESQVREGWTAPAKITLRSLFECMLAAKYALDDPDTRHLRARVYLYCESKNKLAFLKGRLPDTPQGKRAKNLAEGDEYGSALLSSLPADRIQADIASIERTMKSSGMQKVAEEAARLAGTKRKNAAWHEFFGGPRSIEQLAHSVGYPLCYDVLYRLWSQDVHASNAVSEFVRIGSSTLEVRSLRYPSDLDMVKTTAFTLAKDLYHSIGILLNDQADLRFAAWYLDYREELQRRVNIISRDGRR
ncbi:MAG: hypothetical protein KAI24_15345 [Planctomycetes bacterium]|nr:hypothetical protein [Planctomycetota bacterium]